jgi:hypothetical protein
MRRFFRIDSEVDGAGLTPLQYRLVGHLAHLSAGDGRIESSISEMATACRLFRGTVKIGLRELKLLNIVVEETSDTSDRYARAREPANDSEVQGDTGDKGDKGDTPTRVRTKGDRGETPDTPDTSTRTREGPGLDHGKDDSMSTKKKPTPKRPPPKKLAERTVPRARHRRNAVGGKVLDSSWHPVFLETLSRTGNIRAACKAGGVNPQTAYEHKAKFPLFGKQWLEAQAVGVDRDRKERWAARAARARRPRQDMSSKGWHALFLEALTDRFSVFDACEATAVSADLVQKHLTRFPEFTRRAGKIMKLHLEIQKHDPSHHVDAYQTAPLQPPSVQSGEAT